MDLIKIAKQEIKNVDTGEMVTMDSLWSEKTCVIIFFRRWGCLLCRVWAKEISEIATKLKEKDVRLIGIGVEDLGAKEFRDGNFFDGDLFVDVDRDIYKTLGFKRFNVFTILTSLLWAESRAAVCKGRRLGLGGDFKGDGLQNGGALVVQKGGKLLFEFKQNGPAEQVPNDKFLEIIGSVRDD